MLPVFPGSHISSLSIQWPWGTSTLADALTQILGTTPSLRELDIKHFLEWESAAHCRDVLKVIGTPPPNSQVTTLSFVLGQNEYGDLDDMPIWIVEALAGPQATHALEHISIEFTLERDGWEVTGYSLSPEANLWQLTTIRTLRSFELKGHCAYWLTPEYTSGFKESIRARSQSGAPPLAKLSIALGDEDFDDVESEEDFETIIGGMGEFMAVESPTTVVSHRIPRWV